MRLHINESCNICTDEHSTAFRHSDGRISPQITIPSLRARLSINEAIKLRDHLTEAITEMEKQI